jgi:hypothetical protein
MLGYPDTALARVNEGLALAERVNHLVSLALARVQASILHQFRRDSASVLQCIEGAQAERRSHCGTKRRALVGCGDLPDSGVGGVIWRRGFGERGVAAEVPTDRSATTSENRWSSAPPQASRASGAARARCSKRANCWPRFTGGSLRGSIRAI